MKQFLCLAILFISFTSILSAPQIINGGGAWDWNQRSPNNAPPAPAGAPPTAAPFVPNPNANYMAKIDVLDGFVPHDDVLSVGDIKVRVHINDELIGSTRKIQDEVRPNFNEHFMANVKGQDQIKFDIWDMDPGNTDDLEGTFYTTCGTIISTGLNGTAHNYKPYCVTDKDCFLNVKITCI